MKRTVLSVIAVFMTIVLAPTANCAVKKKNYSIEPDAQIYGNVAGRLDIVDTLVKFVKAHGNRCDSVSAASDNMLSKGFTLKCNKYNYTYQILDKGGKWYLQVDQ